MKQIPVFSERFIDLHAPALSFTDVAMINQALGFAACAHLRQTRKYTNEPYIEHCLRVGELVTLTDADAATIAAAILHDTLEDADVSIKELSDHFDAKAVSLVIELTKPKNKEKDRQARHTAEVARLAKISPEAATIKIADIIDNTRNIYECDPIFASVYLVEKIDALAVLHHGHLPIYLK